MNIQEFCDQFGERPRSICSVLRDWQIEELDKLFETLCNEHAEAIGSTVLVGDTLHGDGLLDQIPPEVRDAFVNLMGTKADTYQEMRQILIAKIKDGSGGFLSFDDPRVRGFISKLKGQIGENLFQRHVGAAAELAHSGSQEGWDVAVRQIDGGHDYVQVKLYSSPQKVIAHMLKVQQKIMDGKLQGVDGETVKHVFFAVPADITEQVQNLADKHPG
jgi:hypothetical protein